MGDEKNQQAAPFGAMTCDEFCEAMRINRKTLWEMRKRGEAPEIVFVGRKILITHRAAEQWAREMEAKSRAQSDERETA
ncbi:DNA-binding protein [Paraburkholderia sacchari]|uniref:hypothetical protein n=1 Tax=Paraburkholderia sacchari TaxID=159450 RepID=UPI0039A72D2E